MLLRLRPVVHASPTATGVLVRGWRSSFAVEGGGVATLWDRVATALATGVPADALPDTGPVGALVAQLRAHDMLVPIPTSWDGPPPPEDVLAWLESVAADPARAWRRLSAEPVAVRGSGLLAAAAVRALRNVGIGVEASIRAGNGVLVSAGGFAVAAGCGDRTGFAVAPGGEGAVVADAADVARRLGIVGEPAEVLAALVGSAAAHRLVCAVAGLPDPSGGPERPGRESKGPAVFVADLDPLRAEYHPWFSSHRESVGGLDALCDARLGDLAPVEPDDLPQLPVPVARCGAAIGAGVDPGRARVAAVAAAVAGPGVVAGMTDEAEGLALRSAVHALGGGTPLPAASWSGDPAARRWWKTVTLRFGVPATMTVSERAHGVVHAVVRDDAGVLGWAVESTPGAAAAWAAASAAAGCQVGVRPGPPLTGSGATTPQAPPWPADDFRWPAPTDEAAFRAAARAALPDLPTPTPLSAAAHAAGITAFRLPGAHP
jgi:hypothetical protein